MGPGDVAQQAADRADAVTARIKILAVIALVIYAGAISWRIYQLNDRALKERAAAQGKILVDAGWLKSVTASQAELARTVPALQAQLEAARAAKATVAGTSHWTGSGAAVDVPCSYAVSGPQGGITGITTNPQSEGTLGFPTSDEGAKLQVAVTPHVKIDDAVALDDAGGIFVARKVQARLWANGGWVKDWGDVKADAGSTTKVAPEIEAAWKAWKNPPPRIAFLPRGIKQWRAGWFVGPGVAVALDGRVSAGILVGWGIEF